PRRRQRPAPTGLSTGAKVGIGLGIGFGVLTVIVVLIVVLVNVLNRPGTSPLTPTQAGGATTGPKNWAHDFLANQKMSYTVEFRGGGKAQFWIDGNDADNTNVQIRVYDNVT